MAYSALPHRVCCGLRLEAIKNVPIDFYDKVMLALKSVGFTSFILDHHTPRMVVDTLWCHRGREHEIGYLQGLLAAVERLA